MNNFHQVAVFEVRIVVLASGHYTRIQLNSDPTLRHFQEFQQVRNAAVFGKLQRFTVNLNVHQLLIPLLRS